MELTFNPYEGDAGQYYSVREQALEDAKYEKWEKEALANKNVMPEAPEMQLWDDVEPKVPTANATS